MPVKILLEPIGAFNIGSKWKSKAGNVFQVVGKMQDAVEFEDELGRVFTWSLAMSRKLRKV